MAKVFYRKIILSEGAYTIEDVPEKWRDAVQELLDKDKEESET